MTHPILLSIMIYAMTIAISFLVAALIKGIVVALPLLRRGEAARPPQGPASTAAVPAEHIAAIAAAVTAVIGPGHIIHIEDRGRASAWAAGGRMIHQTSHALTRTRKP